MHQKNMGKFVKKSRTRRIRYGQEKRINGQSAGKFVALFWLFTTVRQ